jgi:preprotein translocase SecF subunit
MYDIVGKRRLWFAISAVLTLPGLAFILLGGLKPSIDFTGGTEWEARYADQPTVAEMTVALADLGYPDALVEAVDGGFLRIRTEPIDLIPAPTSVPTPSGSPTPAPSAGASSTAAASASASATPETSASPAASATPDATPAASSTPVPSGSATPAPSGSPTPAPSPTPVPIAEETQFGQLHATLEDRFGEAEIRSARTVGPIIGADLIRSSVILIIIGELFILGYLWVRFGFRFGTAAIVALLHDVILVVGAFAILGYFFNFEFDALFVTALLTVIGFSVHDTIVVFDRIRENRVRHAGESFGAIVNHSILQTAGRSIITSLTVIVPLTALLLLGPPTIATFTLALLLGILAGTYSSIFNASQILAAWADWDARRKARAR